jgi:hypothetical protein
MGLRALAGVSVCTMYRIVQEGRPIFWEVIKLVVLEKWDSYEHV